MSTKVISIHLTANVKGQMVLVLKDRSICLV